jgi:hypothetical protein
LDLAEALGGRGITGLHIRMVFLGKLAPGNAHSVKLGINLKPQRIERTEFITAAGAITGTRLAIMFRILIARGIAPFIGLTLGRLFGRQSGEVIPILVIFARMRFAEPPFFGAIG